MYEGAWEAKKFKSIDKITLKAKQSDQNVVIHMILGVRKLLKVYKDNV